MANSVVQCSVEPRAEILDEDDALVAAACEDTRAAGRLYDKYYDAILAYVYHSTLDQTVSEDLTSNVFLAAFRHLGRQPRRPIRFRPWLYRIATNEIRMHYRRARYRRADRHEADSGRSEAAPPADDHPAAAEEHHLLHEAMRQLKPKYRTAIALRYFEDRTIAEISEITGRKEGTIRCQLHRGLTQLQDILLRRGVLPPA
jgi:RNA polymerase sigma-70 factor (ECF subfamily)